MMSCSGSRGVDRNAVRQGYMVSGCVRTYVCCGTPYSERRGVGAWNLLGCSSRTFSAKGARSLRLAMRIVETLITRRRRVIEKN
jgi:hypothetical protein